MKDVLLMKAEKLYNDLYNEKQQLISWLEDKIKKYDELIEKLKKYGNDYDLPLYESQAFQEVLDFVNKGGKE